MLLKHLASAKHVSESSTIYCAVCDAGFKGTKSVYAHISVKHKAVVSWDKKQEFQNPNLYEIKLAKQIKLPLQ